MAKQKKSPEPDEVKVEKYTASLKVKLSVEEVADRANQAAHVLEQRDQKEADLKAAQKHGKSIVEELEATLRRLSNEVRSGEHYSSVDCERIYNYTSGLYSEVRTDTGETLHERALQDHERQRELPFEETGKS